MLYTASRFSEAPFAPNAFVFVLYRLYTPELFSQSRRKGASSYAIMGFLMDCFFLGDVLGWEEEAASLARGKVSNLGYGSQGYAVRQTC